MMKLNNSIRKPLYLPLKEEMITVTKRHRETLLAMARKLRYLEITGLHKWERYDEAIGRLDMDGFDEDGFPHPPEGKRVYEP